MALMTGVDGVPRMYHRSRISGRIFFKSRPAADRAEIVSCARIIDLLFGGGRIDGHPAHWVLHQLRLLLWRAPHGAEHFDAARREEPPSHDRHQDQESDIE